MRELRGPAQRVRGDESLVVKFINKTTTGGATVNDLLKVNTNRNYGIRRQTNFTTKDDFILSAARPWTLKPLIVRTLPFGGKFDAYKGA